MNRVSKRHLASGIAALTLLLVAGNPAVAQAHRNPAKPDSIRHIQSMEPRSGPPGTEVTVYTENLPLQAKIVVGVGAIGTGFEELAQTEQGEFGEVGASVTVPASATWDRPLVFIMFNGNFAPTGLSDPFHVTSPDGLIQRTGQITDEGDGCIAMRDRDGYFYTLTGETGGAKVGDDVIVEGTFAQSGVCPQGETIRVVRLAGAPEAPDPY